MPIVDSNLGSRVIIHHPELVNIYGCEIADGCKIGSFVEIQKNVTIGENCKISSHSFICEGVKIQGEHSSFSDIVPVKKQGKSKNHWFYVCLFTGKNREVRKLWKTQGFSVNRLIRVRYGSVLLPENLKTSGWKKLSLREIKNLKNLYKI